MELLQEQRLQYASRSIRVLASVAQYGCGLSLDDTTLDRWHDVMKVMRSVDEAVDAPEKSRSIGRMVSVLETFDEQYPNLSVECLGGARYAQLIKLAAGIIRLSEDLRQADNPSVYATIRAQEANKTADVLLTLASNEVQQHVAFDTQFSPILYRLTRAASFFDSAQDARRDYSDGTLAFWPNPTFRAQLVANSSKELLPILPRLSHPRIFYTLGQMGVAALHSHRLLKKQRAIK